MSTTTTTPPPSSTGPEPKGKGSRRRGAPKASGTRDGRATRSTAVASVNLLSPWVFEELRVRQLRRRFLLGGLVLVLAVALVWAALRFNLHRANEELRGEEAVGEGLSQQLDDLAPVRSYVDGVNRRIVTVTGATYDDVAFSRVVGALQTATPSGAAIETIAVELAAAEVTEEGAAPTSEDPARGLVGSTCPGPDPFGTKVVVGCVTISGTAVSRDAVSGLVIALGSDKLFVEPFVDTTTTGDADSDELTFSGSVGLSPAVFSGKYDALGDELTKGAKK